MTEEERAQEDYARFLIDHSAQIGLALKNAVALLMLAHRELTIEQVFHDYAPVVHAGGTCFFVDMVETERFHKEMQN